MKIIKIKDCPDYVAPDQAVAKEFISPKVSQSKKISVAEITIPPGVTVLKHYHLESEEIYHLIKGSGEMFLDGKVETMHAGEAVTIHPGQWHSIHNANTEPLVMIVTCAPPWCLEDSVFE